MTTRCSWCFSPVEGQKVKRSFDLYGTKLSRSFCDDRCFDFLMRDISKGNSPILTDA